MRSTIELTHDGDGRLARISGPAPPSARLAAVARHARFPGPLPAGGARSARYLTGDASARSYETVQPWKAERRRILMNSPPLVLGPPVRDGKAYAEIAHTARSVSAFVAIDRAAARGRLRRARDPCAGPRPGLPAHRASRLGQVSSGADGEPSPSATRPRPSCWPNCTRKHWPSQAEAAPGVIHVIPPFDRAAMMIEAELLLDWYVPAIAGRAGDRGRARRLRRGLERGARPLADAETSLVLRDYPVAEHHLARRANGSRPARPGRFPGRADRPVGL